MKERGKRGLSQVITTLLLITLALAAIAIIWAVIGNLITKSAEDITISGYTINIEIKQVLIGNNQVNVTVKRNPGVGELSGINFVISDGANSETIEKPANITELGTQTFTLNYDGFVKSVAIQPMFKSESGKTSSGTEADRITYTSTEALKNMQGLVSWWRFEGNANDEMGLNPGTVNGATPTSQGRFGSAYNFNGVNNYIDVGANPSLNVTDQFTLSAWVKSNSLGGSEGIMDKSSWGPSAGRGWWLRKFGGVVRFGIGTGNNEGTAGNYTLTLNWIYITATKDSSGIKLYINGMLNNQDSFNSVVSAAGNPNIRLGYNGMNNIYWNGTIDEVMIFNRSLSAEDVAALYNMDLS